MSISSKDKRLELRAQAIGFELFSHVEQKRASIFESQWWEDQILEWCMKNDDVRTQLLRFVDVFPALKSPRQLVAHLRQYFPRANRSFPAFLRLGIEISAPSFLTRSILSRETRAMITRVARRFIAGENIDGSFDVLREIRGKGMTFTLDLLGEAVLSEVEADRYMNACIDAVAGLSERWSELERDMQSHDSPNLSLKLSSLYSQFDPVANSATKEAVKARLRKILRAAKEARAFVNVDMEQYAYCELTLEIFRELLDEDEFRDFSDAGIVLQAYLHESERLLHDMLQWVERRGTPITIRLVKGAYWDYEIIHAKQMGWPIPVFTAKSETDANFERLIDMLLERFPAVRTAAGTHNIRSMAHTMAAAEDLGLAPADLEFQMLYGMGDPIKDAVLKAGYPLRAYTPFGELIPGMAYLVRRILENTSNESFLRQDFFSGLPPEQLLKDPREIIAAHAEGKPGGGKNEPDIRRFENEPESDFSKAAPRENMQKALAEIRKKPERSYPMIVGGEKVESQDELVSIDPSDNNHVVGRVSQASVEHADRAIDAARGALERWRRVPPAARAEHLYRASELMSARRFELAALEVYEVGKIWREADADVVEAIDYLRYYGSEMIRLGADPATTMLPGETNEYIYRPRGVGAIIAPWNFPLAILTGMSSAAIVAGNTIVIKPSALSPVTAAELTRIYEEAGIPPGVVNYLPGAGKTIGDHLVKSPDVDFITFTGSREVGERINRLAAEHPSRDGIKKVVAEMGGKNAVIIDESADLDEAVAGVVTSAFGYQGQKCSAASRVIALESVHDAFLSRLIEAAKSLRVGPADDPATKVGPLIDEEAVRKVSRYIESGKRDALLVLDTNVAHLQNGFFVGPTIFADVSPDSPIAQEEIFGPVLAVIKARSFDEAMHIANATAYGLTGGVFTRTPEHIERARFDFMVGNLYINRKITGAIVRRQPFGGFKMSGIGSKAGGPDYLPQFMLPQTITENVMRHGFAPMEDT